MDVVGKALAATATARIAAGTGHSEVAVNRRVPIPPGEVKPGGARVRMGPNPEGPADREVQVVKIVRKDGAPVSAMFGYACHSRSLNSRNRKLSGDIFGIAEQVAERELGAGVAAPAFAGASGDVDPKHVGPGFEAQPGWTPQTVPMGTRLGDEVARVYRGIGRTAAGGEIRTAFTQLTVPGKPGGAPLPRREAPDRQVALTAAAIGDLAFLAIDAETFVEIGMEIKARSPFAFTFLITHCNGDAGYLPPAHRYPERGTKWTSAASRRRRRPWWWRARWRCSDRCAGSAQPRSWSRTSARALSASNGGSAAQLLRSPRHSPAQPEPRRATTEVGVNLGFRPSARKHRRTNVAPGNLLPIPASKRQNPNGEEPTVLLTRAGRLVACVSASPDPPWPERPEHRYGERRHEVDIGGFAPEAARIVADGAVALPGSLRR